MANEKQFHPITIIRHRGTPNKGQLPDGTWVEGQDKIFFEEFGGFVPCAAYDNNFIYTLPAKYRGSTIMCSCGSPGIIVGLSGYVHDASPQGKLVVCMLHSTTGKHSNEGAKWI